MSGPERNSRLVPCAIGIRTHSGWAAVVVLSVENGAEQILERQRLDVIDPTTPGAAQPFHFAEKLDIVAAKKHLQSCAKASFHLARKSIREMFRALREQKYDLRAAALLLSSGRPLPDLPGILASHALIHSAEGEFFRHAFRSACEELEIPISGIRERDLEKHAIAAFGADASEVRKRIGDLGRTLGPPWTQDQKNAALAAAIVLASI